MGELSLDAGSPSWSMHSLLSDGLADISDGENDEEKDGEAVNDAMDGEDATETENGDEDDRGERDAWAPRCIEAKARGKARRSET